MLQKITSWKRVGQSRRFANRRDPPRCAQSWSRVGKRTTNKRPCILETLDACRQAGLATYFSTMNSTHPCWCGQTDLTDFSPEYFCCENCQTLVLKNWPPAERFDVIDDASDFYGRSYYESHVTENYGLPSLAK